MPGWIREEHATLSLREGIYLLRVALENNKAELAYYALEELLWYYFDGGKPYLVKANDDNYSPDQAYALLLSLIKFIGLIDKNSKSDFIKKLIDSKKSCLPDIVQRSVGAKKMESMSDREKILLFMSILAKALMLKHLSFKTNKNIYHLLHDKYTAEKSGSSSLNSTPRTRAKRTTLQEKFTNIEWARNANSVVNHGILSSIVHKKGLKISQEKLNLFAVNYDDLAADITECTDKHILLQQLEENKLSEENAQYIDAVAEKLNNFQPELMENKKIPDIMSLLTVYQCDKELFLLLLEQFYLFLTLPEEYIKQYDPMNHGIPMNIFKLLCELLSKLFKKEASAQFDWLYELQGQYSKSLNAKKEAFPLSLRNTPDYIQQFSQKKISEIRQHIQEYHQSGDIFSLIEGIVLEQVNRNFKELKRILPSIDTNDPDKDNLQQIKLHYQAVHTLTIPLPLHYMHRLISFFYNPTGYLIALLVADDELMSELKIAIEDKSMEFKQEVEYGLVSNEKVFFLMQELITPLLKTKLTTLINREYDCFCMMISCFSKEYYGVNKEILTNLQRQFMEMLKQFTNSNFSIEIEAQIGYAKQLEGLVAQWEKTTLWNMHLGDNLHHLIEQSPRIASVQRSLSATELSRLFDSPRSGFRLADSDNDNSGSVSSTDPSSESATVLSDNVSLQELIRKKSAEVNSKGKRTRPRVYSLPMAEQPPWFSEGAFNLQQMLDDNDAGPSSLEPT